MPFYPPLPEDEINYLRHGFTFLTFMMLNVATPVLYRNEEDDFTIFILNAYDQDSLHDFEFLDSLFQFGTEGIVNEPIWYFRMNPIWWDWRSMDQGGDELGIAEYIFRPSPKGEELDTV